MAETPDSLKERIVHGFQRLVQKSGIEFSSPALPWPPHNHNDFKWLRAAHESRWHGFESIWQDADPICEGFMTTDSVCLAFAILRVSVGCERGSAGALYLQEA
jgi:hypothetical protein